MSESLQAAYYILAMNKTVRYYSYQQKNLATIMRIVNASQTTVTVSNLPVFSLYQACVYLVDLNGQIYKSGKIIVETDEGGKFVSQCE